MAGRVGLVVKIQVEQRSAELVLFVGVCGIIQVLLHLKNGGFPFVSVFFFLGDDLVKLCQYPFVGGLCANACPQAAFPCEKQEEK